jgi:hypothetical protein
MFSLTPRPPVCFALSSLGYRARMLRLTMTRNAQAIRACSENNNHAKLIQIHAQSNLQLASSAVDSLAFEWIES